MWCKQCNIETNEKHCPVCGSETIEDIPVEIYWCANCNVPIIHQATDAAKGTCPLCGQKTHYLASDLRPVFPEERLLLALLLGKAPDAYMSKSVWAANSRYYVEGKSQSIPLKTFSEADTDVLADEVKANSGVVDYSFFDENIAKFANANHHRLAYLKNSF